MKGTKKLWEGMYRLSPRTDKPQSIVIYKRERYGLHDFGIRQDADAEEVTEYMTDKTYKPFVDALLEQGYILETFEFEFIRRIGIDDNINLSGYFETAEIEQIFNRFFAHFNAYQFYLRRFKASFLRMPQ